MMTIYNGATQPRNTGIQTSPGQSAPSGFTGGMQITPPAPPRRSTSMGGIQTTPPCETQSGSTTKEF